MTPFQKRQSLKNQSSIGQSISGSMGGLMGPSMGQPIGTSLKISSNNNTKESKSYYETIEIDLGKINNINTNNDLLNKPMTRKSNSRVGGLSNFVKKPEK